MGFEPVLGFLIGIGLSAAAGFRVFVPLLVMGIASRAGHMTLSPDFAWIGSSPALIAFAVATLLEIAGYYIPYVDHLLDTIAAPASVIAGIVVMASAVTGTSPYLRWALAVIAGGGAAAVVQASTTVVRLTSTATTGGLGNPLVATGEAGGSLGLSILAIAFPVAAGALVLALVILAARKWRRKNQLAEKT